ncbi:hypothetical protein K523DRAFT_376780 [Schizophyllum commune Tattone D]|nr:hypothetical protein K523DRAFT_376780 [Schizophyllum commune Tattone D]
MREGGSARRPSSETHHFCLLDLPPDVVEVIMSLSHPLDVLAMRKTCSALHAASRNRWVWLHIAQRTASLHGMPLSPTERAAMGTSDLERFATAPSRSFRALVAASGPYRADWDAIPELHPRRKTVYPNMAGRFSFDDEVFIFPGGSYLMITDKDGDMTLYRLDSAGPEQLGTLLYTAHQFLQDGTVLQIVTLTKMASPAEPWKISVYEIALDGENTGFQHVASTCVSLHLTFHRNALALFGTRVAAADDFDILVWDFALDRRTSWEHMLSLVDHIMKDLRILIYENRVILMCCPMDREAMIAGFNTPGVPMAKPNVRAKVAVFEVPACAVGPVHLWPGVTMCLGQDQILHCPDRAIPDEPFSFQVHTRMPDGEGHLHTYTLRRQLESTRRFPAYCIVPPSPSLDESFANYSAVMMTACDGGQAYFEQHGILTGMGMTVHLARLEPTEEQMLFRSSVRLVQSARYDLRKLCHSFDVTSGRFCALYTDGELLVADYI